MFIPGVLECLMKDGAIGGMLSQDDRITTKTAKKLIKTVAASPLRLELGLGGTVGG
jgi:hypothetical protein